MENIYKLVGTFEFYELSNYIWVLFGIFLMIYATNASNFNLFKAILFNYGILYGTFLGGIANMRMRYVLLVTIAIWIMVEIFMVRKEELFCDIGVFILLQRFVYRILLYFERSMEIKQFFLILSVFIAVFCIIIMHKLNYHNVVKKFFYGNIFILLTSDILVSGLCEIVWKQSDGAWKFFYGKTAVYEYFVYMSKIEIRDFYILLFYIVAFLVIYCVGSKILKLRMDKK